MPEPGYYRELLNSDAELYGGGNVGNQGGVAAEPVRRHGHPQSSEADAAAARRPDAQAGSDIAISDAHSASDTGMTDRRGMRVNMRRQHQPDQAYCGCHP